jgi:hypothetical protein
MFKDVLRHADLATWAEMGLVIFFLTFVGAVVWAMTRRRAEVREWAALPLEGERIRREELRRE